MRTTLYVVKRRLGYGVDEWRALPWWKQRLYLDGLEEEFSGTSEEGQTQSTGQGSVVFNGQPGEMSALGFRERNL